MDFTKWLKQVRLDAGMTQPEFARKVGITFVSICNYENGKQASPSIGNINKLSHFTGVPVSEIRRMIKRTQAKISRANKTA